MLEATAPLSPLLALLVAATPVVVAAIKAALPNLPTKYIPVLGPLLGAIVDITYQYSATDPTLPAGVVTLLGASGVAVREIVDQWKKDGSLGGPNGFAGVALMLGVMTIGGCSLFGGLKTQSLGEKCYVAGQSYMAVKPALVEAYNSSFVPPKTKEVLKGIQDASSKAYDACVTAATAMDAKAVDASVGEMNKATADAKDETAKIEKPSTDVVGTSDTEVTK